MPGWPRHSSATSLRYYDAHAKLQDCAQLLEQRQVGHEAPRANDGRDVWKRSR